MQIANLLGSRELIANPKPTMSTQQVPVRAPAEPLAGPLGNRRLFADPAYHFQALRVLNEVANIGEETPTNVIAHEIRNHLSVAVANVEAFLEGNIVPTQARL